MTVCAACLQDLPLLEYAFCPYCGAATAANIAPAHARRRAATRPRLDLARRPSEHRIVTVMFADVCGFTGMSDALDAETLTKMLNRLFAHISAVVARHEGYVDKFIGDGALILFGTPRAHEDDAERAVRAAGDLMMALSTVNEECAREYGVDPIFRLHAGIATGRVVTGWFGTVERGGFSAIGPPLDLAAQLCDASTPMQVAVCNETARRIAGSFATRPEDAWMNGERQRVSRVVFALGQPIEPPPALPLVGRRGEKEALRGHVRALVEHKRGGAVVITGPRGIGKSRLLQDSVINEAAALNCSVDIASGFTFGTTMPMGIFLPLVSRWLEQATLQDPRPVEGGNWLRSLSTGTVAPRPKRGADQFRERVFDAMLELITRALNGTPRVLVVEDVQFTDATSWDFIRKLAHVLTSQPLLLVVVGRTEVALKHAHTVRLPPLSRDEVTELIDQLGISDPDVHQLVALKAEGIPSHCLALAARAQDLSRKDASRFTTLIHDVEADQLDALAPQDRVRLEYASAFMRFFDPKLVDELLGLPFDSDAWAALEASGIITRAHLGEQRLEYHFRRKTTGTALYSDMPRERRRDLHERIASGLEESDAVAPRQALGWHLEHAGHPGRAAAYWLESARIAVGLGAKIEALNLFEKAAELAQEFALSADAELEQSQLLQHMNRLPEAASLLSQLEEEAVRRGDVRVQARASTERAVVCWLQRDGAGLAKHADRALRTARDLGEPKLIALALQQIGRSNLIAGRYAQAERAYRELLSQEPNLMTTAYLIDVYNDLGECARRSERPDVALMWYEKSQTVFQRTHDDETNIAGLGNRGAALALLGRHQEAQSLLQQALGHQRRAGVLDTEVLLALARSLGESGQLEQASHMANLAVETGRARDDVELTARGLRVLGTLLNDGAPKPESFEHDGRWALRTSVEMLTSEGTRIELAHSLAALGYHLCDVGEGVEGRVLLGQAAQEFSRLNQRALASMAREAAAALDKP